MTTQTRSIVKEGAQPAASYARARQRSATIAFWLFVSPMALGLTIFVFVPIIWGLLLSFSASRSTIHVGNWVGVSNYTSMLTDSAFLHSLLTIVIFAIIIVPITFACSLGLAMLVNTAPFARGFFRTVFFIPTAISYVVASLIWKMSIFNGLPYGFANLIIGHFGHNAISWIATAHPPWYWLVLVTVRLWLQLGFYMIIFLAALQEVPRELYEAAFVDGARRGWSTFYNITLPQIRNTSVAVLVLTIIAAFQAFDEFYNIMGSGLASSGNVSLARTPLIYLYQVALNNFDYGRGSAGAMILTVLILLVTLGQAKLVGFGRKA